MRQNGKNCRSDCNRGGIVMKQSIKQNLIFLSATLIIFGALRGLAPEIRLMTNSEAAVPLSALLSVLVGFCAEGIYCVGKKIKAR